MAKNDTSYESYLRKQEKALRKIRKKAVQLMTEMKADSMYHGLSGEYAERDFYSAFDWTIRELASKRKFAEKHPEEYGTP